MSAPAKKLARFADVAEIVTGSTPPTSERSYYGGTIPFVGPSELGGSEPLLHSPKTLTSEGASKSRLLPAEAVLVCCIGATIGKVGFAGIPLATNQQINALIFDQTKVFPRYAFHFCKTLQPLMRARGASTTLPIMNKTDFGELRIPVLPLPEQKRIAAILDKADAIRRKRQEAIRLTEELLRSAFLEMFGDPVTNLKGWEVKKLGEVIAEAQYGTAAKSNTEGIGLPVLRMNNITYAGDWDLSDIKHCEIAKNEFDKYTTRRGDLLFNRTNSPELVGKTAVWDRDDAYAIAGYLIRVRFNERTESAYVGALLNSAWGKQQLLERAKPSNNMSNFSASELKRLEVPLPPLREQSRFAQFASAVRATGPLLQSTLSVAQALSASLVQRAFSGTL